MTKYDFDFPRGICDISATVSSVHLCSWMEKGHVLLHHPSSIFCNKKHRQNFYSISLIFSISISNNNGSIQRYLEKMPRVPLI